MTNNILKCNQCGATDIEIVDEENGMGKCKYCGSLFVLPKKGVTEEVEHLMNEAQVFRNAHNFDLAIKSYELAIEKEPDNVAAYEGLLLSKYGIEYVYEARTNKYIPTCHRMHFKSIYNDIDYMKGIMLCNDEQKVAYEKRVSEIDKLQKAIRKQIEKEQDYDVFISYKSSDENGSPTEDSVIARDIYDELIRRGYLVFFAEKSLEDRIGEEYEPIIFNALQTSEIFILVGTSKENVESVWVRNEWSRFIDRIMDSTDNVKKENFITVFKGMSPYDFPQVNGRVLQGVDASKLAYQKILADGVERLDPLTSVKTENIQANSNTVNAVNAINAVRMGGSLKKEDEVVVDLSKMTEAERNAYFLKKRNEELLESSRLRQAREKRYAEMNRTKSRQQEREFAQNRIINSINMSTTDDEEFCGDFCKCCAVSLLCNGRHRHC